MSKHKKSSSDRTKKMIIRIKASKKAVSKKMSLFLSRLIPKSRKDTVRTMLVVAVLIAIAGAIPFPYAFTKNASVSFAIENKQDANMELGDSKILQEGSAGEKTVSVTSFQSAWGRLFGTQPLQQKEKTSTITKAPINKSVANGTRKYQYMLCSDGSSKYYPDEQFKDPNVGFTSKSEDYCKKDNQGVKLQLADSLGGTVKNQSAPATGINNVTVPKGCSKSAIPFKTEYQNTTTMQKGTQKVASQGIDGYTLSCPGSSDMTLSPVDQLVFIGTGQTDAEIQAEKDAEEARKIQAEAEKQNERLSNIRSCVSQLVAQGVQSSSAQSRCEQLY